MATWPSSGQGNGAAALGSGAAAHSPYATQWREGGPSSTATAPTGLVANPQGTVPTNDARTGQWTSVAAPPLYSPFTSTGGASGVPTQSTNVAGSPFQSTPQYPQAPPPPPSQSWVGPAPVTVAARVPLSNPYNGYANETPVQPPTTHSAALAPAVPQEPTTAGTEATSVPQDVYVPPHVRLPAQPGREEYADEAVQEVTKHWVDTQYRRHMQQQQGGGSALPGTSDATYLRSDALTGASLDELHGVEGLLSGADGSAGGSGSAKDPQALQRHLAAVRQREQAEAEAQLVFVVSGKPKHQLRLVLLFAVALFGTLPLMSTMALVVLLAGAVVMYVMDFLDYQRATILTMVVTALCFGAAVFLSNFHAAITRIGPTLLIIDLIGVLFVAVAAGLLHFHWVQQTYPALICSVERTIMAAAPLLSMPSIFTTCLAMTGSRYGPVCFFLAMCGLHYTFYCPLESSFLRARLSPAELAAREKALAASASRTGARSGPRGSEPAQRRAKLDDDENPETAEDEMKPQQLNGRAEAIFFTLMLLTLPCLLYQSLQSNWSDHIVANIMNSFGFVCGALVYLCIDPSRSIWFLVPPARAAPPAAKGTAESVKAALAAEEALRRLEYDPLGLRELTLRHRLTVLSSSCTVLVLWAAYRLVTSRHAYVFNGLPFPGNFIALVLIFYLVLFVVIETMQLLDLDGRGVDVRQPQYLTRRALVVLAAQVAAIALCLVSGAPPTFFLPASLSIAAFHLFLLDRTNAGPMIAFTVFSSLMLLWWLYRTFSFLVVDLHVLGEVASVPTPVLSVSVLWMYVLGCITFTLSFSPSKATLVLFLFMYVSQLTWIEHVLYSQKESGTYPGVLVLATTVVGVVLARRLYHNEVLSISAAAFVASCFVAKLPTFLIEVTSSYYYDEITLSRARKAQQLIASQSSPYDRSIESGDRVSGFGAGTRRPRPDHFRQPITASPAPSMTAASTDPAAVAASGAWDRSAKLYALESSTAWWSALVASYVAALFILQARRRLDVSHATRYVVLYGVCAAVLSLCTVRNVQRAVYEFVTQSYVNAEEVAHVGAGTACAAFTLLTMPLFSHLQTKYPAALLALRLSRIIGATSVMLLLVQPTRMVEKHVSFLDYEFEFADYGRWAAAVGLTLLLGGRFLARAHLPLVLRAVYWLAAGLALAFAIVTVLLPVPTVQLFLFVWLFTFLTMMCVDLAHYRHLHAVELYVVYGLSICSILMAFFSLNRVNLDQVSRGNVSVMWEIHEQGRLQLLAVVMASNMFLSVLLKLRVDERPLLPRSTALSEDGRRGVSVIANYATMLTVCVTSVLNFYANDSEPLLYVVVAFFLLMLVDDGELFEALHKEQFRYFPPAVFALSMLWFCTVYHAWRTAIFLPLKIQNVGFALLCGLLTLPAQGSLLRFLYLGRTRGGDSVALVLVTCVLSALMVVLAPQQSVRWMAIMACGGQIWRLFTHRLGEHTVRGTRTGKSGPRPLPTRSTRRV